MSERGPLVMPGAVGGTCGRDVGDLGDPCLLTAREAMPGLFVSGLGSCQHARNQSAGLGSDRTCFHGICQVLIGNPNSNVVPQIQPNFRSPTYYGSLSPLPYKGLPCQHGTLSVWNHRI